MRWAHLLLALLGATACGSRSELNAAGGFQDATDASADEASSGLPASEEATEGGTYCSYQLGPVASCAAHAFGSPIQLCTDAQPACTHGPWGGYYFGCCDSQGNCTLVGPSSGTEPQTRSPRVCCSINNDCGGGQICLNGWCDFCTSDSQCGPKGQCGPVRYQGLNLCTCTTDLDCDTWQVCAGGGSSGTCLPN